VGLRRHGRRSDAGQELGGQRIDERPVQPLCRSALDARLLRHDGRLAARQAGPIERRPGPVDGLSLRDDVRDRRDRQPLHRRRAARRADRRGIRLWRPLARPHAAERLELPRRSHRRRAEDGGPRADSP
jgi:hypothetical protein